MMEKWGQICCRKKKNKRAMGVQQVFLSCCGEEKLEQRGGEKRSCVMQKLQFMVGKYLKRRCGSVGIPGWTKKR